MLQEKMNKKAQDDGIGMLILFGVVATIVLNAFFWIHITPEAQFNGFNSHNLNFIWLTVLYLVILEIIFCFFIKYKKKPLGDSWAFYTFCYKFASAFFASALFWIVIPLVYGIIYLINKVKSDWENVKNTIISVTWPIVVVVIIAGGIFLFFFINHILAKKLGREKTQRFKPGQRVKVMDYPYGASKKLLGKTVTIKKYTRLYRLKIKEDKGRREWDEDYFNEK